MCLPVCLAIQSFETVDSLSQSSDILQLTVQLARGECALLVRDDTGFVLGRAQIAFDGVPPQVAWKEVLGENHVVTFQGKTQPRRQVISRARLSSR